MVGIRGAVAWAVPLAFEMLINNVKWVHSGVHCQRRDAYLWLLVLVKEGLLAGGHKDGVAWVACQDALTRCSRIQSTRTRDLVT
jgi:hypothetical protein